MCITTSLPPREISTPSNTTLVLYKAEQNIHIYVNTSSLTNTSGYSSTRLYNFSFLRRKNDTDHSWCIHTTYPTGLAFRFHSYFHQTHWQIQFSYAYNTYRLQFHLSFILIHPIVYITYISSSKNTFKTLQFIPQLCI